MLIMRTFLLTLMLVASNVVCAEEPIYSFGVVPQQAASKLARVWSPILEYLERETGFGIRFSTARNIPTFEQRLSSADYDIAYMNPYHFTAFNRDPGYQALARARDKRIKGILVVRKDSPIQSFDELDNMTLAFPAPAAFAATILPRGELAANGNRVEPKYVSSHDSVYRAVAQGLYPAGGGVMRTFLSVDEDISDQLRVLWTTEGYTPHAIAVSPTLPHEVRSRLQSALIAMEQSEEGRSLLDKLKIKGFEAARNEDWDDVRALNIPLLLKSEGQ